MKNWLKKATACGALIAAAIASSTSAQAVVPDRINHVLVAGSYISSKGLACTIGVVLEKKRSFLEFSEYQKNMRYAVTAAHCTENGAVILGENRSPIGKTIAIEHPYDTALIELYPISSSSCDWISPITGGGPHCVPVTNYRPRAAGRVYLKREGADKTVPMVGPGSPARGSQLCVSGMMTGLNCSYSDAPLPEIWRPTLGDSKAGHTKRASIQQGDSGGPVTNVNGLFYGIITGMSLPGSPVVNMMAYTPAQIIFKEYPEYVLAPSGW
ncbi:hypothetical protein [Rathayibacter toxicus]|uniref:hypothetical protein n=1 Tax=Rathayibacter toxicus TaxID=145458 RepID=UPI0011B0EA70|nr:hypothetical protein [Rathayibacter toxicus]QWL49937.1 hypothetical protein E2R43_10210 [Rathayibacter toxicus]QWL54336.1 hypothetical protein E2R45_10215 [Rathayibacter toxicus]